MLVGGGAEECAFFSEEFDVERYLRDAKLAEIGEGTNEVQKMVIARELLKARG